MSESVTMEDVVIDRKVWAILRFGPASPTDGNRGGEYFQGVIDPNMVSPEGTFIRFDQGLQGGEIHGWQRVDCMTICELLSDAEEYKTKPEGYTETVGAKVIMRKATYG